MGSMGCFTTMLQKEGEQASDGQMWMHVALVLGGRSRNLKRGAILEFSQIGQK